MTPLARRIRPWSRWLAAPSSHSETIYVSTEDDVRLAIHRVPPAGGGKGPVVMLLHGLGANRFGWMVPQRSLAKRLSERGFDVFIPELRGAGESGQRGWRWDLEDYVTLDLPAILRGIRDVSGQKTVHWIGHSMGGVLLCCYAIRHRDHGVQSGVTIASALNYSVGHSGFRNLYAQRHLIERIPLVPFGPFSHLIAPALGRVRNPIDSFNFWRTNVEPEIIRAVYANTFEWIPISLLTSLATTFEPEGLRSRDGAVRYLECAAQFEAPILLLGGSRDVQCSPEAVEATARAIGPHAEVALFGKAHGHADEYGHFDLIVGRRAPEEVWPAIEAFLRRQGSEKSANALV